MYLSVCVCKSVSVSVGVSLSVFVCLVGVSYFVGEMLLVCMSVCVFESELV